MNDDAKAAFIHSLTTSVARAAIDKIPHMPAEWDGHELRQYLADKFAAEVSEIFRNGQRLNRSRRRAYRNTVATENL